MNSAITLPVETLTDLGFVLQGALDIQAIAHLLPESARNYQRLLVLGHAGRDFWSQASKTIGVSANPLDEFSRDAALQFLDLMGVTDREVLFPGTKPIDLKEIGRLLGWHHDSPLGTGIHPIFGSWFAYRVVVAVPRVFEVTNPSSESSPCESCKDKPCLSACPVGATGSTFDLEACGDYRLTKTSCAEQCLARNACPVGSAYRYDTDQMRYHYRHSLDTLRLIHSDSS